MTWSDASELGGTSWKRWVPWALPTARIAHAGGAGEVGLTGTESETVGPAPPTAEGTRTTGEVSPTGTDSLDAVGIEAAGTPALPVLPAGTGAGVRDRDGPGVSSLGSGRRTGSAGVEARPVFAVTESELAVTTPAATGETPDGAAAWPGTACGRH